MTTTEQPDLTTSTVDGVSATDPIHFEIEPGEPWPEDVPRHQDDTWWRYRGDPKGARRAELRIAFCWGITVLAAIGLMAVYVAGGQPQAEGALLFFAFGGLGVGLVLWARDLLPGHDITASRAHNHVSGEKARVAAVASLDRALAPMARRPFLSRMLALVGGVFGIATLFPLASLGPRQHRTLFRTAWGKGTRAVTEDGTYVKPSDLLVNGILTIFPETDPSDPQGAVLLLNLGNFPFEVKPGRQSWDLNGVVAFSKICTHAGCPVGLYNVLSHQLVCPCHQSTFDVERDCKPVFGPAPRPLPQLPIAVDKSGYIVSQSDFTEPVGPGFWGRP